MTEPVPVTAECVHFLVHPGYDEKCEERFLKRHSNLYQLYIEKVLSLGPKEIVLAFEYCGQRPMPGIDACMKEMRNILGQRLVMTDGTVVAASHPDWHNPPLDRAREMARSQGYQIHPLTSSEAWGETLRSCVPKAAQLANIRYGLWLPTTIRPQLTSWFTRWRRRLKDLPEIAEEIENLYPNVIVDRLGR